MKIETIVSRIILVVIPAIIAYYSFLSGNSSLSAALKSFNSENKTSSSVVLKNQLQATQILPLKPQIIYPASQSTIKYVCPQEEDDNDNEMGKVVVNGIELKPLKSIDENGMEVSDYHSAGTSVHIRYISR